MERGSALVTGASRGLGAFIAQRLGADGWPVAVNYPPGIEAERDRAVKVAADIRAAGGTSEPFAADVTEEAQVRDLVARITAELGAIQVLVVNATGLQPAIALEELTWQAHLDQLEFFVKSPTLLVQAALPAMKQRGTGRIVRIGSAMPERALPGWSAYAAAKAAQLSLTRVWAKELGPAGAENYVRLAHLAPGIDSGRIALGDEPILSGRRPQVS